MRNLLDQQDQLADLESRLNCCDDAEDIQLRLNSRRHDTNQERRDILEQVDIKLRQYNEAVHRFDSMLRLPEARERHCQSVYNWVDGNKPLVRSESACYLGCLEHEDYIVLGFDESDKAGMESLIDVIAKKFPAVTNHVRCHLAFFDKIFYHISLKDC
ncbi:hypothetical protein F5B20DRAFT_527675 [Whalleya microplaca]|nr:hypothetical protein F5B20DRAFT_527675 [Whalleya microplaca]